MNIILIQNFKFIYIYIYIICITFIIAYLNTGKTRHKQKVNRKTCPSSVKTEGFIIT